MPAISTLSTQADETRQPKPASPARRKEALFVFLLYLLLAVVYFSRAFIQNRIIDPEDSFLYYYPLKQYYATSFLQHGIHLWIPYEFLGLPFLGTYQTGILYPPNFLYFILPTAAAFNLLLLLHYAAAACFTYLYARLIGLPKVPSFIAGIAFGLSGFMMAQVNHVSIQNTAVWLPLLLYLYEKIRREPNWRYSLWAGLVVAIQILAGQFQICVYGYIVLFLFIGYRLWRMPRENRPTFITLSLTPLVLGAVLALPQLVATKELADRAWRIGQGYDFFTSYSFHPLMLPVLAFPFLFGDGYGGPYWGAGNLTEMCGFIGSLPIVLCAVAILRRRSKSPDIRFWGIVLGFSFLLTLGGYFPLAHLFFHVPLYNLFRVPARNWMEFDLAAAILSGFGFQWMLEEGVAACRAVSQGLLVVILLGFLALAGGTLLLAHPWPGLFVLANVQSVLERSFSFTNPAFLVPLGFMVLYLVWLHFFPRRPDLRPLLLGLLCSLILAESYSFGGFHHADWDKIATIRQIPDNPLMRFLNRSTGINRVAFVTLETIPLFNIPDHLAMINGYDPLMLNSFHQLVGIDYSGASTNWKTLIQNNLILSATNVKYVVVPRNKELLAMTERVKHVLLESPGKPVPVYRPVFQTAQAVVFQNLNCLPKAFAVTRLRPVGSFDAVKEAFGQPDFNPARTALVFANDLPRIGSPFLAAGKVTLTGYDTDRITLEASFQGKGFVVLSDQYYPGWKAFVDGHETPIWQVDGLFRGVVVPAGHHAVVFRFLPASTIGTAIAAAAVLVLCITSLIFRAFQ